MSPTVHFFFEADLTSLALASALNKSVEQLFSDHRKSFVWLNAIILSSDDHTTMNRDFLGHDYATDVITFPADDLNGDAGEVYINEEMAAANAAEYNVTTEQEIARLVIHGALHLVGYDDHSTEDQQKMSSAEDKYLALANSFM